MENKEAEMAMEEGRGGERPARRRQTKKKKKEDGLAVRDKSFAPGLSGP